MKKTIIIAEAGVNHNGSLHIAKNLIKAAKFAGADYVKFQSYLTEELCTQYAKKSSYQYKTTSSNVLVHSILLSNHLTRLVDD